MDSFITYDRPLVKHNFILPVECRYEDKTDEKRYNEEEMKALINSGKRTAKNFVKKSIAFKEVEQVERDSDANFDSYLSNS